MPVGEATMLETTNPVQLIRPRRHAPDHDGGIRWDSVGIDWPIPVDTTPELSPKDTRLPALAEFVSPFPYDGRPLQPLA